MQRMHFLFLLRQLFHFNDNPFYHFNVNTVVHEVPYPTFEWLAVGTDDVLLSCRFLLSPFDLSLLQGILRLIKKKKALLFLREVEIGIVDYDRHLCPAVNLAFEAVLSDSEI